MAFKKVDKVNEIVEMKEKDSIKPLILGTLAQAISATAEATGLSVAEVSRSMLMHSVKTGFNVKGFEIDGQESAELLLQSAREQIKEIAKEAKEQLEVKAEEVRAKESAVEVVVKPSTGLSMPPPALKKITFPKISKGKTMTAQKT